ncbi:hypothetical protein N2152v2_010304 [Parachlorella kessleri]
MEADCNSVLQALEGVQHGEGTERLAAAATRAAAALKNKSLSVLQTKENMAVAAQIWNAAIDMAQGQAATLDVAALRQCASELVAALPLTNLPSQDRAAAVNVLLQTGRSWAGLQEYEAADAVLAKGIESAQWLQDTCFATRSWSSLEQTCAEVFFGLLTERMLACRQLKQQEGDVEQAGSQLSQAYEILCTLELVNEDLEAEVQGLVCQALQTAGPERSSGFVTPFLAHHLLLQQKRFGEAQTELLNIVSHEDAIPEVCMAAITAALAAPEGLESVQAALPMVLERFSDDPAVILALAGVLTTPDSASVEVEELVLEAVGDDRWEEEPEHRLKLHGVLWNHAVHLLEAQQYERALRFFSASLAFVDGTDRRLSCFRSQAVCCLCLREFNRAQHYLSAAEQPKSLPTGFLRLKVALAAQAAASAAVSQLMGCEGASPDMLRIACLEAQEAGVPSAAKQALVMLLDKLSADSGGDSQQSPGYEATVFTNLIKLILDNDKQSGHGGTAPMDADSDSAAGDATEASLPPAPSRSSELAKHLDAAVQRMKAVGHDKFFGMEASQQSEMQQAALLMAASGEFWAAHQQPTPAVLSKQKAAFLFAATSALDVHSERPEFDNALALAGEYLLRAKQAAGAAQSGLPLGAASSDPKADAFLLLTEFQLATRRKDIKTQLEVIERSKGVPGFTAECFAKLAALCKDGSYKNLDVCKAAQQAALQRLTSDPAMNYPVVAATLRSLIELSRADVDKLQLLREAQSILDTAPKGTYPDLETRWLITHAWNRGHTVYQVQGGQEGIQYMQLALDMLNRHCPTLAAKHKEDMEAALAAAVPDQAQAGGGNP